MCWGAAVRLTHDDSKEEGPDLDYAEPERPPVIKDHHARPYGWGPDRQAGEIVR